MITFETKTDLDPSSDQHPEDVPVFEQDTDHRLNGEMCLVHNIYRILSEAGVELPTYDQYLSGLTDEAFSEEMHRWMHRPVATYIRDLYGANLVSLDVRYADTENLDRILRFGRVVTREGLEFVREIEQRGVPDDVLELADLFLQSGKSAIISVRGGFNGYNGSIRPGDTHSLRYMGRSEDGRVIIYDNDERPYEDLDDKRPIQLCPIPGQPAKYVVDEAYLRQYLNTHAIAVWPGESIPKPTPVTKEHSNQVREQLLRGGVVFVECDGFGGMRLDELDGMTVAYSDGINVDDGQSIYDFTSGLYGEEVPVMTIDTSGHTTHIVDYDPNIELEMREKKRALFLPGKVDGVIFRDTPEMPFVLGGADCQICVGVARDTSGKQISFALHMGTRGILGGITELFVDKMKELDIEPGTLSVLIGPSAYALEYQQDDFDQWAMSDSWRSAVLAGDGSSLVYSPIVDCINRLKTSAGDLLGEIHVADADTQRIRSLFSHRRATNGDYAYCGSNGVMLLPNA